MELSRRGVLASMAALPVAGASGLLNPAEPYAREMHALALELNKQPLSPKLAQWAGWCLECAERMLPLDLYHPYPAYSAITGLSGFAGLIEIEADSGKARRLGRRIHRLSLRLADMMRAERARADRRGEISG